MSVVSACLCLSSTHNTYMLMFWICTACGGTDVIRILDFDEDEEPDDNKDEKDDDELAARNNDMNHST